MAEDAGRSKALKGAQGRVAALLGQRKGVRRAVQALAHEALGDAPPAPGRVLSVARAIRAGIAGASGIRDAEAHAAAEEALRGLQDELARCFDALLAPANAGERATALEDARALQREFGAGSPALAGYIERLAR